MRNKELISLVLVILVLSMPIDSAIVLGAITSIEVSNKNGFPDYISYTDDYFKVEARFDNEKQKELVKIDYPEYQSFSECHSDGSSNICTFTAERMGRIGGEYSFNVLEFDSDELQADTKSSSFVVDTDKPTVTSFTAVQEGENVSWAYSALDTACPGCGSKCSGLDEYRLMEGSTIIESGKIEGGGCSETYQDKFMAETLGVHSGSNTLCIEVTDKLSMISDRKCVDFGIDIEEPEFEHGTLRIYDSDGDNITYVASIPLLATVEITVSDPNLDPDSVYADLSKLNSIIGFNYDEVKGTCTAESGGYTCIFNVMIDSVEGNIDLIFSAKDDTGNLEQYSIYYPLEVDSTPPDVNEIYVNPLFFIDDELILKMGQNQIYVMLDGTGSGYSKGEVYLDLSLIGGSGNKKADECEKIGGNWICKFTASINQAHDSTGVIFVKAEDDAGNSISSSDYYNVRIDSVLPVVNEIELSSECAIASEGLTVDVTVQDDNEVVMFIDASEISSMNDPVQGDCAEEFTGSGEWLCSVELYDLYTMYVKDTVEINITDAGGNTLIKQHIIEICEEDDERRLNVVEISMGTPSTLDKRLISFISTQIYIPLSFSTSFDIIDKSASCTDTSNEYFLNEGTSKPTLVAKVNKMSIAEGETTLTIDCSIDSIVRKGRRVYSIPERDNISIVVPLYNNALGEMSEEIEDDIDDLDDEIDELGDQIDMYDQWNYFLGQLCTMADLIAKVHSIIMAIKSIYHVSTCALYVDCAVTFSAYPPGIPICQEAPTTAWRLSCGKSALFSKFVENLVWPTGALGNPIGMGVKYGCILYSCRICDWGTFLNIVIPPVVGGLGALMTYEGSESSPDTTDKSTGGTPSSKNHGKVVILNQKHQVVLVKYHLIIHPRHLKQAQAQKSYTTKMNLQPTSDLSNPIQTQWTQ